VSSGDLFDTVISTTDKFMEIYFGKYGKGQISSVDSSAELYDDREVVSFLREAIMFLNDMVRNRLINENDTDLLNIKDDLVGSINKTLYLFTFN
jgi:hypothetical protein